ncbi:hypothetical protein GJ744_007554 [Endocarpon pusillum]|uniref:Tat pathway signal sequence n=1 Tax=Endocarpon pusillum TaxID=364733 RepID=A0A8H7E673_9EURO|nr:hypothetical protein GJ744_007554 [Endocarpon pusillum]
MYSKPSSPIFFEGSGLEDDLEESLLHGNASRSSRHQCLFRWFNIFFAFVNILTAALIYLSQSKNLPATKAEFRPLRRVVTYQDQRWDINMGKLTEFTKPPNPEVDASWNSISAPPGDVGALVLQKHELDEMNITSIPYADGSGYIALIDVFHQLHCLDFLRKVIFNSTYQMSESQYPLQDYHIAHCIDSIRLSLQCHADLSLIGLRWIRDWPMPWPDFQTTHQCRNFDEIKAWAKERMPTEAQLSNAIHPQLRESPAGFPTINPLERVGGIEYMDAVEKAGVS